MPRATWAEQVVSYEVALRRTGLDFSTSKLTGMGAGALLYKSRLGYIAHANPGETKWLLILSTQ
jgi:hypothetical protein